MASGDNLGGTVRRCLSWMSLMADTEFEENQETSEDDVFDVETSFEELHLGGEGYDIPHWLQNVQSPFNWLPTRFPDVPSKEVIAKATERIEMDEGFDATFPFEKFVRILTLVFEFSHQGEEEEAWKHLALCEELLEEEEDKDVTTYKKLEEALIHTVQANKAHLLFHRGSITEAIQITESIQPVSVMTDNGQAAVQGIRARFFYHYRSQGARLAVQYAREALRLAPDEPLWQVLTAESIRRLRKFLPGTDEVSAEEVSLLESAVNKQRNARHLVLLAQAYRECGDSRFKLHRSQTDFFQSQTFLDISDMQAKAFELYKEALALRPDYEVVNRLCGYGLLKLPAFKSDYRLAERCLQKALEQSPNNPTTLHSLGLYHYKGLMEYEKAALFCEKAGKLGNFPASLDMLRMKRLVYGHNYDPVFDFRKLLLQYGDEQTKRHEVLCQMGSYYLFFERNLSKALRYFKILMKEKAELSIMTSHKCTFLNMACKINLFECIVNEGIQLLQRTGDSTPEGEENNLEDIKLFLDELKVTNPELFDIPLNINLIDDLHKVSDDIKQTYIRKKERRDSCKDKRRNSLISRRSSLDDNLTFARRQSEGSANFRRKSSGNVSDALQNRMFRMSNNSNFSSNKQKVDKGVTRQMSDPFHKTANEMEKSLNSQKRYEFYKSYGYHIDSGNSNYRRRSSGAVSDLSPSRSYKSPNSPKYKQQFFDGVPPQISESVNETLHETEKNSQSKNYEFYKHNGYQNSTSKNGHSRPQYKRNTSWSGNIKTEKPKTENWRKKDGKECI